MQPDKKQLEILLVNYFRTCYDDFPKGRLSPSESPDFIVKMRSRRELGIELTRLNPASKDFPDEKQLAQIQVRDQIIGLSQELFEQSSALKLFVKFLFSDVKEISAERQMSVAVQAVNLIRKAIGNKSGDSFFRETISGGILPEGLDEILIVNHPVMQIPAWERANNLGVSNDVVDDIRRSIHKKDEKLLRLYQKQRLNYYWLLITTDRLHGVKSFNLPERIMNHDFHSEFQHVFLFDLIKAGVFQLV
ncbi:MAG TPA: hypothetical protein VLQ91_15055 [Draconibacterium sp.]|nr:hypothetical protein [Draconibacterium sp.]